MDILLSIKPIYAHKILEKQKTVEFRKKIFSKKIDKIFIYSSSPEQRILGFFTIKKIEFDSIENLWNRYNQCGGINEMDFREYFKNKEKGYALLIDEFFKFKNAVNPFKLINAFKAPQNFCYCNKISYSCVFQEIGE